MTGEKVAEITSGKSASHASPDIKIAKPAPVYEAPKKTAKAKKPTKIAMAKASTKNKTNAAGSAAQAKSQPFSASNSSTMEPFAHGNEVFKAMTESSGIYSQITKNLSDEFSKFGTKNLSDNMELSREFFSCRTISDMFEIQNRIMQRNLDNFFRQTAKMSEVVFRAASQSGAPLNTSLINATDCWKKAFTARMTD